MKFSDYFKDVIEYGENLGFKNTTSPNTSDFLVSLNQANEITRDDGTSFYPVFF